jgi:Domain of unknown function (DUF4845)
MSGRQRGITFLGGLLLLIPIAIVVYAAIRLTPVYLNYMRVARSLDAAASSVGAGGQVSAQEIRNSLGKQFDIQTIDFPTVNEIQIRRNGGGGWVIEAKYEDTAHLFGNISLLVDFDKISPIGG